MMSDSGSQPQNIQDLVHALSNIHGVQILPYEPIRKHTPLRVGGPVSIWARVSSTLQLQKTISAAKKKRVPWKIHWPFEDWLVRDAGYRGLIIRLEGEFEAIHNSPHGLCIGASALWSQTLFLHPASTEVSRWPGSVGSLLVSSERGLLKGFQLQIHTLCKNKEQVLHLNRKETIPSFSKYEIPLKLIIQSSRKKRGSIPIRSGMIFCDKKVGTKLQNSGLCGTRLNNWRISAHKPGQVVQLGGGSCQELQSLIRGLQERVLKLQGFKLKIRVPVIGERHKPTIQIRSNK